jgi:acyl-CoA synthetase (AMP-forming)/AMP-acid ligase II
MATYKAPRIVEIVEQLPRSATGKIAWRELQEREMQQTAQPTAQEDGWQSTQPGQAT